MKNVFSLLLLFAFISCKGQADSSLKVTADDFEKGINGKNAQVLDVRTAAEYNSGHIKNALQSDWTNPGEFNERIQYVDKDKPVYVYCLVGGRSATAARKKPSPSSVCGDSLRQTSDTPRRWLIQKSAGSLR